MIKKIVLTGGPGTGKTTVLEKIEQVYGPLGYKVIVIDETATYLILKGIRPYGEGAIDLVDFQELVMRTQLAKEEVFERAGQMMGKDANVLIVYDRGTIDNCAYMNEQQFEEVLSRLNHVTNLAELMNNYDLVINLVGRKDFYTIANNEARSEDAEYALELGKTTLKSWIGHNKIKIVPPKDTMEEKVNEVLNYINEILCEKPVKKQEKYAVDVKGTDLEYIQTIGREMHIIQDYLMSSEDVEKRVRKVEFNGCEIYYFSVYKIQSDRSRVIVSEKRIDKKVYEQLLDFKDKRYGTINKTRYYFAHDGKYYSLDVFDDNEIGILEINVSPNETITLPYFVDVLECVTNNVNYYNQSIAKTLAYEAAKRLKKA